MRLIKTKLEQPAQLPHLITEYLKDPNVKYLMIIQYIRTTRVMGQLKYLHTDLYPLLPSYLLNLNGSMINLHGLFFVNISKNQKI